MKKGIIWLVLLAMLLSVTSCAAKTTEPGITLATEEPYDPLSGDFPAPPDGYVVTEGGKVPLRVGGYNWSFKTEHKQGGFIADQAQWPMPLKDMKTVTFPAEQIDGADVHLVELNSESFAVRPGRRVTLDWQVAPDTVSCICWHVDHEGNGISQIPVECTTDSFIANQGSFIYEFTAGWLAQGRDYGGKASYYIHVIVETED